MIGICFFFVIWRMGRLWCVLFDEIQKRKKNSVCKNVTFLRIVAGKHFVSALSLSLTSSLFFFFSFTKMVIVYIVMRFRAKRFCFQRFRVTSSWVLRCVLVRWPHHRTESLCLTAASERIRHIIDGVFERNVSFSIIFSSAIPAFHVRCIISMFKRDENAFDVESESFTFTSAPKTITICLKDYRCWVTLFFSFLFFAIFLCSHGSLFFSSAIVILAEKRWIRTQIAQFFFYHYNLDSPCGFMHTDTANCSAKAAKTQSGEIQDKLPNNSQKKKIIRRLYNQVNGMHNAQRFPANLIVPNYYSISLCAALENDSASVC